MKGYNIPHLLLFTTLIQVPDELAVTLCQCITCMNCSLLYLPCPPNVVPTNCIVWGDVFVLTYISLVYNAEGVERGIGGGAWGGRIKMVSSVAPAAAKQDTTRPQLIFSLIYNIFDVTKLIF